MQFVNILLFQLQHEVILSPGQLVEALQEVSYVESDVNRNVDKLFDSTISDSFLERAIVTHLSEDDCEKSGHNESQESKTAEKVDKPLPGQRSVENVCKASNQSVSLKPFVLSGKAYWRITHKIISFLSLLLNLLPYFFFPVECGPFKTMKTLDTNFCQIL